MHGLSRNVCMSSRTCTRYFQLKSGHWILLEVNFLWAPLVRSVRIVKCRHYLPGSCSRGYSSKAFIYSLTNNNGSGHAVYNPVKLQVNPNYYDEAVTRCPYWGLVFGSNDITISNYAATNQDSATCCGRHYSLPQGYSLSGSNCTFCAGSYRFTPTDIEVFYETTT